MNLVYVIIVYGLLHNVQTVLPQTYPDQQSCTAALVQTHLTFGNWGSCEPLAAHAPDPVVVVPAPAKARLGWGWDRGHHRGWEHNRPPFVITSRERLRAGFHRIHRERHHCQCD